MRYLPHTDEDRQKMLKSIGVSSIDDLFNDVSKEVLNNNDINLPNYQSEIEVEAYFEKLSDRNLNAKNTSFFVGGGLYHHHVPAAVDHLIQRGEFLTTYTPYQPEISQGTLQALFEFQTQIAEITGMDVANASLYDGSTSCVEAVLMANRITKRKSVLLSGGLHPHYTECVKTYANFTGFNISTFDPLEENIDLLLENIDSSLSCVVVQNPDFLGRLTDWSLLSQKCKENGVLLVVVVTEIISLGLLKSPGEMGADIVAAEGQSLGNMLNFGGPTVGLFATRQKYLRQMPGRLAGQTVDTSGKKSWALTLSTREQHIRREKATSNVCTNAGLCSLAFTIHMALLGESSFKDLADLNHQKALQLYDSLSEISSLDILNESFFNEFTIRFKNHSAENIIDSLAEKNILAGIPLSRFYDDSKYDNYAIIAATEMVSDKDIDNLSLHLKEFG